MRANRSARPARTADARRRRRPLTVRAVDSRAASGSRSGSSTRRRRRS